MCNFQGTYPSCNSSAKHSRILTKESVWLRGGEICFRIAGDVPLGSGLRHMLGGRHPVVLVLPIDIKVCGYLDKTHTQHQVYFDNMLLVILLG